MATQGGEAPHPPGGGGEGNGEERGGETTREEVHPEYQSGSQKYKKPCGPCPPHGRQGPTGGAPTRVAPPIRPEGLTVHLERKWQCIVAMKASNLSRI